MQCACSGDKIAAFTMKPFAGGLVVSVNWFNLPSSVSEPLGLLALDVPFEWELRN